MRHETSNSRSGSHIPLVLPSSVPALEARSIGTSNIMLAGRPSAKNIGTSRYAGVVRRGRKYRRTRRTMVAITRREIDAKTSEPTGEEVVNTVDIVAEEITALEAVVWRAMVVS